MGICINMFRKNRDLYHLIVSIERRDKLCHERISLMVFDL